MKLYKGVVEDIQDPLKLGRVRVRVFGLHSDDKTLIPVETLPWAIVATSTFSASMSGIGYSPSGLLPGSWVLLVFQDVDEQYPIVIHSFHGIPSDFKSQITADEELEFSDAEAPTSENVVKDSSGNTVTDGQGEPVKTTPPPAPPVSPKNAKVIPAELGSVSAKYESSGNPGTISAYANGSDLGGASYGAYQFASYLKGPNTPTRPTVTQTQIQTSPIIKFVNASYPTEFEGLSPATPEFDAKWKSLAAANKTGFLAEQHKYIERNYYQIAVSKLPTSITNRGKAIHEAIWSMSVQMGPSGCASKFKSALGTIDASVCDDKAIELLYNARISSVKTDFQSSPDLWASLVKRFNSERDALVALAKTYDTGTCGDVKQEVEEKIEYKEDNVKEVVSETKTTTETSARQKGERGFKDPIGKYPLYFNEADTHRLARGVITGTVVEPKRSGVVTGKSAGNQSISEPSTQYNTKYPYNKVICTESGHIIELDDTPGYERVHIYHKSGTFVEFHPDGKMVTKVRGTNTLVVSEDNNTITLGNTNMHTSGNQNESINGNLTIIVDGSINVKTSSSATVTASGNVNITSGGTAKITAPLISLN
jgi:hypothetical protein